MNGRSDCRDVGGVLFVVQIDEGHEADGVGCPGAVGCLGWIQELGAGEAWVFCLSEQDDWAAHEGYCFWVTAVDWLEAQGQG